jgi:steroid delta-isomerase-like uncharacterized protein
MPYFQRRQAERFEATLESRFPIPGLPSRGVLTKSGISDEAGRNSARSLASSAPQYAPQHDDARLFVEPAPIAAPSAPVAPGETADVSISLVNADAHPAQIELFATDMVGQEGARIEACNLVFQPGTLTIDAGKSADMKVQVVVPVHTAAGTYSGLIRASRLCRVQAVLVVEVKRAADGQRDDIRKEARQAARIRLVDEHVRVENTGDIEATLGTFGEHPHCVVNGQDLYGHDSIRGFYRSFFRGFPDLKVRVNQRHVSEDAIILEVTVAGTHLGVFNGVPASGRNVEIPLCAIFKFDRDERILGEWVYFDNALVMQQLGAMS